jgi:hypothetical protein
MRVRLRGIAPVVVAAILALAIGVGSAVYLISRPAAEAPLTAIGTAQLISYVETRYVVEYFVFASDKIDMYVYLNGTSTADIYVLLPSGSEYVVVASEHDYASGSLIELNYAEELVVLAWRDGYVDAVIVNMSSPAPGEVRRHTERHPDPMSLAQYVKVTKRWWDILWEGFSILFSMMAGLRFVIDIVAVMLPYAGAMWAAWLISAIAKAIKDLSIEPIVDFFYKNYQIVRGIVSAITQIVLKIIDLLTGPAT